LPFLSNAQIPDFDEMISAFDEKAKKQQEEFGNLTKKEQEKFENFKKQQQYEFAEFLRNSWTEFELYSGMKSPKRPDPVNIPVADPDEDIIDVKLPVMPDVPVLPDVHTPDKPDMPDIQSNVDYKTVSFDFLGCPLNIEYDRKICIRLPDIRETTIADAWIMLLDTGYEELIYKCYLIREYLQLNDWAYYLLLKEIASNIFPPEQKNERALFLAFMLSNSGFKMKMGTDGQAQELLLMIPTEEEVYEQPYLEFSGEPYYVFGKSVKGTLFSYENQDSDASRKKLRLTIFSPLKIISPKQKTAMPAKLSGQDVAIFYNESAVALYEQYPMCELSVYFNSECSDEASSSIRTGFAGKMAGKMPVEQVAVILKFMHSYFPYKTDEEQFGKERYFFYEETLAYPYSDCEDNAALFTFLVRKLTGLKAVGLLYEDHVAAAVCFDKEVAGSYILHKGEKYVVCDPTYSGARIGQAMPACANMAVTVIEIK
jgi:hypothetical protein